MLSLADVASDLLAAPVPTLACPAVLEVNGAVRMCDNPAQPGEAVAVATVPVEIPGGGGLSVLMAAHAPNPAQGAAVHLIAFDQQCLSSANSIMAGCKLSPGPDGSDCCVAFGQYQRAGQTEVQMSDPNPQTDCPGLTDFDVVVDISASASLSISVSVFPRGARDPGSLISFLIVEPPFFMEPRCVARLLSCVCGVARFADHRRE